MEFFKTLLAYVLLALLIALPVAALAGGIYGLYVWGQKTAYSSEEIAAERARQIELTMSRETISGIPFSDTEVTVENDDGRYFVIDSLGNRIKTAEGNDIEVPEANVRIEAESNVNVPKHRGNYEIVRDVLGVIAFFLGTFIVIAITI